MEAVAMFGAKVLISVFLMTCAVMIAVPMVARAGADATEAAHKFVAAHEAKLRPLEVTAGMAWWNANVSGKDEDFQKKEDAQNRIDEALADRAAFATLKEIKDANKQGQIADKNLARMIDLLYLQYLEKQVDPALLKQIVAKANAVEKAFNVYRAKVDAKEMTDSEVRKVLKESTNSERRQAVWEASKGVGAVVAADLKELVNLRNQA